MIDNRLHKDRKQYNTYNTYILFTLLTIHIYKYTHTHLYINFIVEKMCASKYNCAFPNAHVTI